ncbi:MAG: hypothetical protein ACRDDD_07155 [Plesiomonas sp.]|uniref:hypothetical protein n=1 Tax=Plesiomonas sp. TaxID=2486279 RepID=UPI003EE5D0FC
MKRYYTISHIVFILLLAACGTKTSSKQPVDLAAIQQLRAVQSTHSQTFSAEYPKGNHTLSAEDEKQFYQFIAQQDPSALTVSVGPTEGDPLHSAQQAHQRLKLIEKMLIARPIALNLQYTPQARADSLRIEVSREQ